MKKQTWKSPAQIFAEDLKQRKIETLTAQIEKLVKDSDIELSKIFDIFQKAISQRGSYHAHSEFIEECQKTVIAEGSLIIDGVDMLQEYALYDFCKENDIKIIDC